MYGYSSRQAAWRAGDRLRKKMKNPKAWKVDVYRTNGWSFTLCSGKVGQLQLHEEKAVMGEASYWTLLSNDSGFGGEVYWSPDRECFDDPNKAVEHQVQKAKQFQKKVNATIQGLEYVVR